MIPKLLATGGIAPWIIALTVLEVAVLYRRLSLRALLPNVLAGDFLLLAWWLSAAHWVWAGAALLGAGVAHLVDVVARSMNFSNNKPSRARR
jgi:hypothetical protein